MFSSLASIEEAVRNRKTHLVSLRWVDVGLWDEPYGRHLYGLDHHHCTNAALLLIAVKVYQQSSRTSIFRL
jgi:hypothetical protein